MKPKLLLSLCMLLYSLRNAVVRSRLLEGSPYSFEAGTQEWLPQTIGETLTEEYYPGSIRDVATRLVAEYYPGTGSSDGGTGRVWESEEERHPPENFSGSFNNRYCRECAVGSKAVATATTWFSPALPAVSGSSGGFARKPYGPVGQPPPEPIPRSSDWQYRWMASLRNQEDDHICGGTLIAAQVILTAAHCFDRTINQPASIDLGRNKLAGKDDSGFKKHQIKHVLIHKDYSRFDYYDNDIALLVLDFPTTRATTELASVSDCFESEKGCELQAFGWGVLDYDLGLSEELRVVSPPTVNQTTCQKYRPEQIITANMLCAGNINEGGIGNCIGDSGGPVFILEDGSPKQVGIVSWSNGCGDSHTPEVMTSVPALLPWITEQLSTIDKKWSNTVPDCWQTQALCMEVHRV